jgi:chitosanase
VRFRAGVVAFGAGTAVVLCVPLAVSVTADAADDVLLSRNRPVRASSTHSAAYAATNVADVNNQTRWASVSGPGTQWLRIDLGRSQPVRRVKLNWEKAYATRYRIQVSGDGTTWTDLYATAAGDGEIDDRKGLSGAGRYLRVLALTRATTAGYSLREVQVYGPGPAAPRTPQVEAGSTVPTAARGLTDPKRREIAFQLVSTAENSTLDWRGQYGYIEDIGDGRGYTAGIVGFCSGTSDMLALVTEYTRRKPDNKLAKYLPALRTVDGSDSHAGLDPGFTADWTAAAADPVFQKAQEDERDRMYFHPAVTLARTDGLRALGQFAYYDAAVMHGMSGLRGIRNDAMKKAKAPRQGGDEIGWLTAFLDARVAEMRTEEAHSDTTRVDTAQRVFLRQGNLDLNPPLTWSVYGDRFEIRNY